MVPYCFQLGSLIGMEGVQFHSKDLEHTTQSPKIKRGPHISTPHQVKVQKLFEGSSMPFSISLYSSDWNRHTTTPGKKNFSLFLIVLISSKLFPSLWIGCLMALFLSFIEFQILYNTDIQKLFSLYPWDLS